MRSPRKNDTPAAAADEGEPPSERRRSVRADLVGEDLARIMDELEEDEREEDTEDEGELEEDEREEDTEDEDELEEGGGSLAEESAEFQAFLAVQEAEVLRGNAELERKVRDFARAERVRRGSEARGSGKARVGPGRDAGLARGFLLSA